MNILLINHYAGSPELGMEFRPFYLAKEWIKQGHQVYILASTHSHIRAKNPDFNQRFTLQELEGINYIWLKTPKYDGNGISRVKNIASFLFYANQYASKISEMSKPDLVIASSTYPADNYLAHRMAKKNKAKHIYEVP